MLSDLKKDLSALACPEKGAFLPKFFKTGKGQYAEGDLFLGVTVPNTRAVARKYRSLSLGECAQLLLDPVHEHRLLALFILVDQYEKGDERARERVVQLYLKHLDRVNNWDLVDSSAPKILGAHLFGRDTSLLHELAASDHLWKQRIAIIATQYFIRRGEFAETLLIAEKLLRHPHDLIHKAVGWMLREVGERDRKAEERFLKKHHRKMPRTMLRYAIEKFDEETRQRYLKIS